jgi:hypothetical protein
MTAHFVAPNTSPDIRYAVYFRCQGAAFNGSDAASQPASMLNPWLHWPGINGMSAEESRALIEASRGGSGGEAAPTVQQIAAHYAVSSNDHTAAPGLRDSLMLREQYGGGADR